MRATLFTIAALSIAQTYAFGGSGNIIAQVGNDIDAKVHEAVYGDQDGVHDRTRVGVDVGPIHVGVCLDVDVTKNGVNVAGTEFVKLGDFDLLNVAQAVDLNTCGGSVNVVFNGIGGSGTCACSSAFDALSAHNVCPGPKTPNTGTAACTANIGCHVACKNGLVPTADGLDCACASGFELVSDTCGTTCQPSKPGASQRARSKARRSHLNALRRDSNICDANETACLIDGGRGGFECLDVQSHLQACGGCVGEGGVDCTKITGASSVGCSAGKCVVFSCKESFGFDSNGQCSLVV